MSLDRVLNGTDPGTLRWSDLVTRIRAIAPDLPIAVSLDMHANIFPDMVDLATIVTGYHTYPHVDMYETGERTARILVGRLAGTCQPVMALAKRDMIISPVNGRTTEGPMTAIVAEARRLELDGEALAASYFMVQPWLDFEDPGVAALVCLAGDAAAHRTAAERPHHTPWERRTT